MARPMVKVPIDEVGWTERGIQWWKEGAYYRFGVPERDASPKVWAVDGNLMLLRDGSSYHKALLIYLTGQEPVVEA